MTKLTALAATVAIAIVAAGCGSVAEQNDYVEQVNAEQTQLLDSIGKIVSGPAPTNSQQAAEVAGNLSRAFATSADEIEAIEPPDNVAELHGQLVDGMRGLSDRLREAQRRARRRQRPARGRGGRRPAARDEQGPGADSGPDRPDQRRARELARARSRGRGVPKRSTLRAERPATRAIAGARDGRPAPRFRTVRAMLRNTQRWADSWLWAARAPNARFPCRANCAGVCPLSGPTAGQLLGGAPPAPATR